MTTTGDREKPSEIPEPFVFVSYTAVDVAWATWVAAVIENAGLAARLQEWDSLPGKNFVTWIDSQLAEARWTIALYSDAYFTSAWCTTEWTAALARKTLLPVRLEPVTPPATLSTLTWVDLFDLDEEPARARLLRAVGRHVEPRLGTFPGRRPSAPAVAEEFPGKAHDATREPHLDEPQPTTATVRATLRRILPSAQQASGNLENLAELLVQVLDHEQPAEIAMGQVSGHRGSMGVAVATTRRLLVIEIDNNWRKRLVLHFPYDEIRDVQLRHTRRAGVQPTAALTLTTNDQSLEIAQILRGQAEQLARFLRTRG